MFIQIMSPNFWDMHTILASLNAPWLINHDRRIFIWLKKMILNARHTAVRVRYDVYAYVRVPNLCCAFREFSTQNINRTIDWRDIGQCNLNGHKQKSKINKQVLFEFILTLSVHFWSFQTLFKIFPRHINNNSASCFIRSRKSAKIEKLKDLDLA